MPLRSSISTAVKTCLAAFAGFAASSPANFFAATAASAASDKDCDKNKTVGGQALMEGVMMRGAEKLAWAVRKPSGEIVVESFPFVSITKRVKFFGLPVVRGVAGLFESMKWGYRALSRSADLALEEENNSSTTDDKSSSPNNKLSVDDTSSSTKMLSSDVVTDDMSSPTTSSSTSSSSTNNAPATSDKKKSSLSDQLIIALSMLVAVAVSISLFTYAPMWVAKLIGLEDTAILFRLTAGAVRIALILIYMLLISQWKETRRLFEYHGAEHKTILAYEDGKPLTFDAISPYTTIHPRCGTSFIVLVAICGIFMSTLIDMAYKHFTGDYALLPVRFALSLAFFPLLAGVSYEALKLSAKFKHVPIVNFLILPGLLVQRITTKPPNESQVEVAVKALEGALRDG